MDQGPVPAEELLKKLIEMKVAGTRSVTLDWVLTELAPVLKGEAELARQNLEARFELVQMLKEKRQRRNEQKRSDTDGNGDDRTGSTDGDRERVD